MSLASCKHRSTCFYTAAASTQVTLPCGAVLTFTTTCPFEEWARYINANAAALGVPELPAFTHRRVFVVPDAFSGACGIGFWNGRVRSGDPQARLARP